MEMEDGKFILEAWNLEPLKFSCLHISLRIFIILRIFKSKSKIPFGVDAVSMWLFVVLLRF